MNEHHDEQNLRHRPPARRFGDGERWRWLTTAVVIMLLVGVFTYQNPQLWQEEQQISEQPPQQLQQLAQLPEPPVADEPPAELPQEQPQPQVQRPPTQVDVPPQVEQLAAAVAVSAAPESWLKPLAGGLQRSYGFGFDQTCGDYRFHSGADYAAPVGSKVQAMAAGTVTEVTEDALWGGVVTVTHGGGWQSIYKGLVLQVKEGAAVEAGDVLGSVMEFAAESAQESHLHVELHLEEECVDPEAWL